MKIKYLLVAVLATLVVSNTHAAVYECKTNGNIQFQSKPCAGSKAESDKIKANQSRIQKSKDDDEKRMREFHAKGLPKIGMTRDQAENTQWGYPDKINTTKTSNTVFEQMVFRGYRGDTKYIHLTNGRVTSITE